MTDRNLLDLDPALLTICRQWQRVCAGADLNVKVIVTWRDAADQDAAKAECLSNASAGQSPHNCCDANGDPASRAFDFGVFEVNGDYVTNGEDPRYAQAAEIGETLGLVWGGKWLHPDWDHLEMANWQKQPIAPCPSPQPAIDNQTSEA